MAIKVIIPTALRQYTDGQGAISVDGATVGEVLQALTTQYPAFGNQLYDGEGKLRSFVNIYRNDDDVRYLDGMNTTVSESDDVSIIPAIAGGRTMN